MESQPQNPEFRNNPENFHKWIWHGCGNNMTWSHFIQVKLEISIYLSWDKYKVNSILYFNWINN